MRCTEHDAALERHGLEVVAQPREDARVQPGETAQKLVLHCLSLRHAIVPGRSLQETLHSCQSATSSRTT